MTVFEPVIDERAIITYVAQTFAGWHWGVARREYVREWLDAGEPLSDTEIAAMYPVTKSYLADNRRFDSAWVHQALDEVESLCNHWKAGSGAN